MLSHLPISILQLCGRMLQPREVTLLQHSFPEPWEGMWEGVSSAQSHFALSKTILLLSDTCSRF